MSDSVPPPLHPSVAEKRMAWIRFAVTMFGIMGSAVGTTSYVVTSIDAFLARIGRIENRQDGVDAILAKIQMTNGSLTDVISRMQTDLAVERALDSHRRGDATALQNNPG